jgi:hypothetical protein
MQVAVTAEKAMLKHEAGHEVEGIILTCSRCGERIEVYGTSGASVRRGCARLREGCKEKTNFYVCGDGPTTPADAA